MTAAVGRPVLAAIKRGRNPRKAHSSQKPMRTARGITTPVTLAICSRGGPTRVFAKKIWLGVGAG